MSEDNIKGEENMKKGFTMAEGATHVVMQHNNRKLAFTLAEGATHVAMQHNNRKLAFTLAEVLVTLAVIGIVAAMTIPNLVQSYKKKVIETRLVSFYSTFSNLFKFSEIDNGDVSAWDDMGTTEEEAMTWYKKYFQPYLRNVSKVEFAQTGYSHVSTLIIYFNNGTLTTFALDGGGLFYPNAKDFVIFTQKNGDEDFLYPDMKLGGIKYFYFQADKNSQTPFDTYKRGWNGTKDDLINNKSIGCNENARERAYCTELIKQNGWKIPDDYPFKF